MADELETLYRARLPEFRRVAAAIAGDRELGRDAVQEAFAAAVRKRRSYRGDGTLEAWVWRIVVNAARDARRRNVSPAPAAPATNGHAPVIPLDLLTERQREIVFLGQTCYAARNGGALVVDSRLQPSPPSRRSLQRRPSLSRSSSRTSRSFRRPPTGGTSSSSSSREPVAC